MSQVGSLSGFVATAAQHARLVDDKNARQRYAHRLVGLLVVGPIAVARKVGILRGKQALQLAQTAGLEEYRRAVDDLLLDGDEDGLWVEEDRTLRQMKVVLAQAPQKISC